MLSDIDSRRFWSSVRVGDNGCWDWMRTHFPSGYGQFNFAGGHRVAHRIAYEIMRGPVPEGLELDHLCRNRGCVNPAHLEAVTPRENILRGVGPTARAAVATECPHGHPYDEANTWVKPSTGERKCRACKRASEQRRYAKRKAERVAPAPAGLDVERLAEALEAAGLPWSTFPEAHTGDCIVTDHYRSGAKRIAAEYARAATRPAGDGPEPGQEIVWDEPTRPAEDAGERP